LHRSENKAQAENKEIIKTGTTSGEEVRKAYCVTAQQKEFMPSVLPLKIKALHKDGKHNLLQQKD